MGVAEALPVVRLASKPISNMQILRTTILAAACASLASCAGSGPIGESPMIEVAELSALPAPAIDEVSVVRPQDSLRISVLGFPELSRELLIGYSGAFQFPLIGMVQADGRTPLAIAEEISSRLRGDYVVNPEVTVDVLEQPGRLLTVGGEVTRPGRHEVSGSMTLLEAVATGGGTTDTAKLNEVLIFRTVNGQRYIGLYDLGAIQRGNYPDPLVYAGDIVQVGDSPTLRRIQAITALAPLVTTPIILLDRVLR